jgi:hypothetical protein
MRVPTIAPPQLVEDDVGDDRRLIELLSDTLKSQTNAITQMGHELKDEMRATRHWMMGLTVLCILLMASFGGVGAYVNIFGFDIDTRKEAKP